MSHSIDTSSSSSSNMMKRGIVIIGATGVGKSKLSIEIAKAFNGEIINADSSQMYIGQDIATNKVSVEEQQNIPHHMLSFLSPTRQYTVRDFRDDAIKVIDDISGRGKVPVIVGGTFYYIQSLLWPSLMDETRDKVEKLREVPPEEVDELVQARGQTVLEYLTEIDPESAKKCDALDERRVHNMVRYYLETGQKPSVVRNAQAEISANVKYPCAIFWLQCEKELLRDRLDKRVDTMMQQGLFQEACDFIAKHHLQNAQPETDLDLRQAAFQTIGYKEFLPMMQTDALDASFDLRLKKCVSKLKTHHHQYAKRQLQWIRRKILTRNLPVYGFPTDGAEDPKVWERQVLKPATDIAKSFLSGSLNLDEDPEGYHRLNIERDTEVTTSRRECKMCGVVIVGDRQWEGHINSKRHRTLAEEADFYELSNRPKKNPRNDDTPCVM